MSNTVIQMAAYRPVETASVLAFLQGKAEEKRGFVFHVSQQLGDRVYFPDRVSFLGTASFFPLSKQHHADAVYENAVRFLEQIYSDESFA